MKKIVTVVMVALMICSITACGSKTEKAEASVNVKTVQPGKLVVATNATFPPYETVSEDGNDIVGIDIDVAQLLADELGLELEVVDMDFSSVIASVQLGKCDIGLAGLTITEERLQNVNFSIPFATGIQSIIVKDGSEIESVDDLAGHLIGVQESTTGHIYCEDDFGTDYVIAYNAGAIAVQALYKGFVDCVVIDNNPAKEFVKNGKNLHILDTAYSEEEYAAAISKDNEELLKEVDRILKEKMEDGTIQDIIDNYIKAE